MAIALSLLGCNPPAATNDGGGADGWSAPGVPGTVELLPPAHEDPGIPIDLLTLRVASIRMVGDRGPALDPQVDGIGLVSIGAVGLEVPIGDVPPALYSAVVLTLAPDADGQDVLHLRTTLEHGPTLDITTVQPLTLDARCEHGAVVNTTDAVRIGVDLPMEEALGLLVLNPLPAPDATGVIHVDEASAPEAIAAFRRGLAETVHAECGPDAT
jgi:hypothetical protein